MNEDIVLDLHCVLEFYKDTHLLAYYTEFLVTTAAQSPKYLTLKEFTICDEYVNLESSKGLAAASSLDQFLFRLFKSLKSFETLSI